MQGPSVFFLRAVSALSHTVISPSLQLCTLQKKSAVFPTAAERRLTRQTNTQTTVLLLCLPALCVCVI